MMVVQLQEENHQLREEIRQLQEENRRLQEENRQLRAGRPDNPQPQQGVCLKIFKNRS